MLLATFFPVPTDEEVDEMKGKLKDVFDLKLGEGVEEISRQGRTITVLFDTVQNKDKAFQFWLKNQKNLLGSQKSIHESTLGGKSQTNIAPIPTTSNASEENAMEA